MTAFSASIRKLAKGNKDFRREVATGGHSQVVLMCLRPGEAIGEEIHEDTDQIFVVARGRGEAVLDGVAGALDKGTLLLVPAGMRHDIRNTGDKRLRIWRTYLAGCAHAFEKRWVTIQQVVVTKTGDPRANPLPWTREHLYRTSR